MVEPQRPRESAQATSPAFENRLSLPFGIRFPAAVSVAVITGLSLGLSHGGKRSGLRFRAENSHRFPSTPTGWYLYHKSKNYHMMLGGIGEGLKMGSKIAFWAGGFFLVEEAVDRLRGTKDFISTVVAGLSISGGFSAWSTNIIDLIVSHLDPLADTFVDKFPLPTAGRTIAAGLYGGVAFGLLQDALGLARGRKLQYIDSVTGRGNDRRI